MAGESERPAPDPSGVRAQLLATEHWSLLATRSMIQGEVLTRISMFLTLVSAVLVTLALVGQATGFGDTFGMAVILLLTFTLVVGMLTMFRVVNASLDDLVLLLGMNRLRAAYAELDPGLVPFLSVPRYDDFASVDEGYYPLGRRPAKTHVWASSAVFIGSVNAALAALLGATVTWLAGGGAIATIIVGIAVGVVTLAVCMWLGYREYNAFRRTYTPVRPREGSDAA